MPEAAEIYQQAIALKPHLFHLHHNLGCTYGKLKKLDAARDCYLQAIALQPNQPDSYLNLANLLTAQDRVEASLPYYLKLLELVPDSAEAHYNYGNVLSLVGKQEDAIPFYQRAIALKPDFAAAYAQLGTIFTMHAGKVRRGLEAYQRAIELNPNLYLVHYNLGNWSIVNSEYDRADYHLKKAVALEPDLVQGYYALGLNYLAMQNLEEALACYHQGMNAEARQSGASTSEALASIGRIRADLEDGLSGYAREGSVSLKCDFVADSTTLLISFGSINPEGPALQFEFVRICADLPVKKLFVRDLQQSWYHQGLFQIAKDIDGVATHLRQLTREQNIGAIVTLGGSSGGYAAMLFGWLLDAEAVHAFSPQTVLDADLDPTFGRMFSKRCPHPDSRYTDLLPLLRSRVSRTQFHIHYGRNHPLDRFHAQRLSEFPNVLLHPYDHDGHQIARWLRDNGTLRQIVEQAVTRNAAQA